jgi:hypothetical protein
MCLSSFFVRSSSLHTHQLFFDGSQGASTATVMRGVVGGGRRCGGSGGGGGCKGKSVRVEDDAL